jgi:hypothetical protein
MRLQLELVRRLLQRHDMRGSHDRDRMRRERNSLQRLRSNREQRLQQRSLRLWQLGLELRRRSALHFGRLRLRLDLVSEQLLLGQHVRSTLDDVLRRRRRRLRRLRSIGDRQLLGERRVPMRNQGLAVRRRSALLRWKLRLRFRLLPERMLRERHLPDAGDDGGMRHQRRCLLRV